MKTNPKYKATHVSTYDGCSTAMALGYDEDDEKIMLVNEDGQRWTDPIHHWRLINQPEPRKYTVSGNAVRITRLDAEGNEVGEPIDMTTLGKMTLDVEDDDVLLVDYSLLEREVTLEFPLDSVSPEARALLFGEPAKRRRLGWAERRRLVRWIKRAMRTGARHE